MIDNRESSREYVDTTVRLLPQDTFKVTNDVPVRAADFIAVKNWIVTDTTYLILPMMYLSGRPIFSLGRTGMLQARSLDYQTVGLGEEIVIHTSVLVTHSK